MPKRVRLAVSAIVTIVVSSEARLLQNPVLDAGAIAHDRAHLKYEQHADGDHHTDGEAQAEHAHHQGAQAQVHGGQFIVAVVDVPVAMDAAVEGAAQDDDGLRTPGNGERQEPREVRMIAPADARVDPRTVVVHFLHAPIACVVWSLSSQAT